MSRLVDGNIAVIVPNWNGASSLKSCLSSLQDQSIGVTVIVVDNGSVDESLEIIDSEYSDIVVLEQSYNHGFAGGVNIGIDYAIESGFEFILLFNNDAVAHPDLAKHLYNCLLTAEVGVATCSLLNSNGKAVDSTGESYSVWGLPFSRGRDESGFEKYKLQNNVFGASGGASLYRVNMLKEIGLFDEDFFAYYEDVDISFRAQLAGWKVKYVPEAIAYHDTGSTSRKIKGFTTYQTMKNQPLVVFKNVPTKYLWRVTWRFTIAHTLFFLRAISRGQGWIALKGDARGTYLLFKKLGERRRIQKNKKVTDEYIWSIMTHDLPPNAHALRKLRTNYWKLRGRQA